MARPNKLIRGKSPGHKLCRLAILCCLPLAFWAFYCLVLLTPSTYPSLRLGK